MCKIQSKNQVQLISSFQVFKLFEMGIVRLVGVIMVMKFMIASGWTYGVSNGLNMNYYIMACPFAEMIIKNTVNRALQSDRTLAAALIRMHFHDCFVEVIHSFIHALPLMTTFSSLL